MLREGGGLECSASPFRVKEKVNQRRLCTGLPLWVYIFKTSAMSEEAIAIVESLFINDIFLFFFILH